MYLLFFGGSNEGSRYSGLDKLEGIFVQILKVLSGNGSVDDDFLTWTFAMDRHAKVLIPQYTLLHAILLQHSHWELRHRGTHISKVRSVELDRWNASQVQRLRDIGNMKSNEFWEHSMPEEVRILKDSKHGKDNSVASDARRNFIINKYSKRSWIPASYDPDL